MFESTEELEALRDRPTSELAAIYTELDALEGRVRYQRLFVLGLLDDRRVAEQEGATDTVAWVAGASRLQGRSAAAEVRAARRLAEQPAIAEVAAEGRLSRDQLDPLLEVATPDTDQHWANAAPTTAPGHLAYRARQVHAVAREEAERRRRDESLSWQVDADAGMVRGRFALADVDGATFVKAIEREMERAGPNAEGKWEPHDRRAARALVALASQRLVDDADSERATITIVAPAAALADGSNVPGSELPELEVALAIDTVRRLACDATTQLLITSTDGVTPIGLGRRQRTVPPWLKPICASATTTADSLVARGLAACTLITEDIGPMAAAPIPTTCSCCAPITTTWCTKAAGRSAAIRRNPTGSHSLPPLVAPRARTLRRNRRTRPPRLRRFADLARADTSPPASPVTGRNGGGVMVRHGCSSRDRVPLLRGPDDVIDVLRIVTGGSWEHCSGELVLGFDGDRRIKGCAVRGSDGDHPPTDVQQLIDIAGELLAVGLVLVTFVDESQQLIPNAEELERFEALRGECADEDIALLDHILVSGHRWRSVSEVSAGRSSR